MVAAKASLTVIYPAELPDFRVEAWEFSDTHWEMIATRDDTKLVAYGTTYDKAMNSLIAEYNHYDGWPIGPSRLDPHRGTPAAWRGPVEQRMPPAACKLAGQPTGFVFDPMQDLDRALARARKIRHETLTAAGRWIATMCKMLHIHKWEYIGRELNCYGMGLEWFLRYKCRICGKTGEHINGDPKDFRIDGPGGHEVKRASRRIKDRWHDAFMLAVFIFVVVALFAVYGHWSTSIWMETIQ